MRALWASLVPDPKAALREHMGAVLAHLSDGLGDRMWRAREASCAALAELLPGRGIDDLQSALTDLHLRLLRALDDVKETVRAAAATAWRSLCSACVRLADGANSSSARAQSVLDVALPALLDHGLLNASDEVRRLCAKQLLKLCTASADHLAPHTVKLVPALLENLSVLEDPMLSYAQLQAERAGVPERAPSLSTSGSTPVCEMSPPTQASLRMRSSRRG